VTLARLGRPRALLLGLVAFGALLRFGTLGLQNFWPDEAVTAALVRLDLPDMLDTMSATESTPPLYYLVARGWVVLFGDGEVGLRALSALTGTLTIPVVYAAAEAITSRKTALVVAALAAVNPALVWYSQEARSYAMVVLLGALSLLFLVRAVRSGSKRDTAWWAVTGALALLTHYFAGFLVAGEALWLLASHPRRRAAAMAVGSVAACCLALLPLAVHQSRQGNLAFIEETPLPSRVRDIAELFLTGPLGYEVRFAVPALEVIALAALALLLRAHASQRRSLLLPAALALGGISVPVLLALIGPDYVLDRNFLPFWLPAAIVVAVGLNASRSPRAGAVVGVALLAGSIWLAAAVPLDRSIQREAITAGLVPEKLDPEEQRIATRIAYAVPENGSPVRAVAACPAGYTSTSGGASWVADGPDERLRKVSPLGKRRGWAVTARPDQSKGRTLSIYAICVRPVD
jgi:mannosyltransferase